MILLFCLALCLLTGIVCTVFQRKFIYFHTVFTRAQVDELARKSNLERWKNPSGETIGMKRLSPKQPAEGQILVAYGNGDSATWCARYADVIQSVAAFDVFILEYPGYEDRPGSPSQTSLFLAADEAIGLLPTNVPIYLVGESLGTGVAAYLGGTYPDKVAGMVLFAPYNRFIDVVQYHSRITPLRGLLTERFPSDDYLRNYHGPVGILVAGKDWVIPEKLGRRLYDGYAGPKHLWEFPTDDHQSVTKRSPEFWKEEVIKFWQANPK